jgi:hypothetical protein
MAISTSGSWRNHSPSHRDLSICVIGAIFTIFPNLEVKSLSHVEFMDELLLLCYNGQDTGSPADCGDFHGCSSRSTGPGLLESVVVCDSEMLGLPVPPFNSLRTLTLILVNI